MALGVAGTNKAATVATQNELLSALNAREYAANALAAFIADATGAAGAPEESVARERVFGTEPLRASVLALLAAGPAEDQANERTRAHARTRTPAPSNARACAGRP